MTKEKFNPWAAEYQRLDVNIDWDSMSNEKQARLMTEAFYNGYVNINKV